MPIHILAPDVVAKIAAGEVVERPANVIKELLENSLDAEATEVRVEIREGGQRLLRVTDNGHGIPADEVPLAFARHATSKLTSAEDLNQIMTYGFRGEALYSIAAVSHTTLTTRHRDESFGSQIQLEGGNVVSQGRAGTPVGTILNVEHLFFNVPARKKFLRQPATETGLISEVIKRYALAFPDRRFSLVVDGRLTFQSSGSGDLYDVLVKVFGLENARQFVPIGALRSSDAEAANQDGIEAEVDFMELAAPPRVIGLAGQGAPSEATVSGYASLPSLTRANRNSIELFINRRYVEDRTLTHAVVQAYHTLLPVGRYPLALIFLEVDPNTVDVNVHPQKTQVRLVEERRLFNVVQRAVRRALVHHAPIPDMNLPAPAPPADAWSPSLDAGWAARRDAILNAGTINADNQAELDFYVPQPPPAQSYAAGEGAIWSPPPNAQPLPPPPAPPQSGPARQQVITQNTAQLPPLRVVGQVGALYIIAEGPEGLYLIDQHAAHERILYEQFMAQRYGQGKGSSYESGQGGGVPQQHLLEPLTLHIGHELTGLVAHHLDELQTVGFSVEPFGGDTFLVRAVPAVLSGQDPLRALEEIVTSLAQQRNQVGEELEARLVKMVCKRAAIKAGQMLSPLEMQELVRQLEACQSPRTCPHGRPTMIQLSAGELEKAFGRIINRDANMTGTDHLHSLMQDTITRYHSPLAQVMQVSPVAMADHERGWSGAEIRRYKVNLQQGESIMLLTKTMPLKERRVMALLSQEGLTNVPFAHSHDLTTDGMVLTCLQDLGSARVGIPIAEDVTPTTSQMDQQVAHALAAIHVPHLQKQQQLAWLPATDLQYVNDFLIRDVWRGNWEDQLRANPAFAAEFAQYTPALERAASQFASAIQELWQEGDSLTLTHGEVHGEHIMLYQGRPYLIDWGWSYYGPFYLDLPAYFTPQTVHYYHQALAERGIEIPLADFMERYDAIGRYVGFKYLCSGIWLWPPGPTSATGQRILMTIKWALDGTWPARAFSVSPSAWHQLLAEHNRRLSSSIPDDLAGSPE